MRDTFKMNRSSGINRLADDVSRVMGEAKQSIASHASQAADASRRGAADLGRNMRNAQTVASDESRRLTVQAKGALASHASSAADAAGDLANDVRRKADAVANDAAKEQPMVNARIAANRSLASGSAQADKFSNFVRNAKQTIGSHARQAEHDLARNPTINKLATSAKSALREGQSVATNMLNNAKMALASGAKNVASGMTKAEHKLRASAEHSSQHRQ